MRIALKIAYNGKKYHGFARQPNVITIEEEILKILIENEYFDNPKKSNFKYASRTDKSVSAFGNIISFNTNKTTDYIFNEINQYTNDIIFYGFKEVKSDFFPRYANYRIYSYYLKNKNIIFKRLIDATSLFIGTHNFSNFARIELGRNPIRTIENITINDKKNNFYQIDFFAQTYLWNQIRRMISAIIKYINYEIEKKDILDALENPNKKIDFGVANPDFLILRDIIYDFKFDYNIKDYKKFQILKDKILKF